MFFYRTI